MSAFSNIRALSTDFTALRLRAQVGVLLLPLPRQFVQVAHYLADVLHALSDAVGHRRGDGRLIVAEDEASLLQNASGRSYSEPTECAWSRAGPGFPATHRRGKRVVFLRPVAWKLLTWLL